MGSGIIVLLLFGVFAVVALVGGNVMRLFGFRYDSVRQMLLYFLLGELLGLFSMALPKALHHMGKVNLRQGNFLYMSMYALFTMPAFWLADQMMHSISTTGLSLASWDLEQH